MRPGAGSSRAKRAAYRHRHGVVTLTCGTWGNVLRLLPPLAIPDALLEEALDVLAEAFASAAADAGAREESPG